MGVPLRFAKKILSRSLSTSQKSFAKPKKKEDKQVIQKLEPDELPKKLLRKTHRCPDHFYLNSPVGAELLAQHFLLDVPKNSTVLEVNPGYGLLTKHLLNNDNIKQLLLYETYGEFIPKFEEQHNLYPDRIKVQNCDIINLWKLVFRDKMDNGTRVQDALNYIPKTEYLDDINMKLFAAVGSINFFKFLVNDLVFQYSLLSYGRCEMFLVVPPPVYITLTCNDKAGYLHYRAISVLFQIIFQHKFIARIPRMYFLPGQFENTLSKNSKLTKINSIDPDYLYLIKVEPRRNLYDLCSLEDMPALWFFIKQNFLSRKTRVIPKFEKWIPGCGPRLIVNTKNRNPVRPLYDDENLSELPLYSTQSTTMSTADYIPLINIFTQFGDLSPSQVLTLYYEFRNWPEYKDGPFLASLENSLIKMEQASDENADGIEMNEEDDEAVEDNIADDSEKNKEKEKYK